MKHILNFLAGALLVGGLAGIAFGWIAFSVFAARWITRDEPWGFFVCIVIGLAGFGGVGFAASEASKSGAQS